MSVDPVYQASPIKRIRSTKAEVGERRQALFDIVQAMEPMTVRQVFYQATVRGLVEKAESGYAKVQTDLTKMRRDGQLPYDWLADNTRWQRKPRTFDSVEAALQETAKFYRKSLQALRALDDFTITDGERAVISGEMEVEIVRPADDGGARFRLTIKFPSRETLDVRIARAQLLQQLDVEADDS